MAKLINKINKKENKFFITISKGGFVKDLETGKFLPFSKSIEILPGVKYLVKLGNFVVAEKFSFSAEEVRAAEKEAAKWRR